jgi:hypothetical protein
MAVTINWSTKIISVPKSYLTLVSGSVYELDTDQFRLDLKALEDDEVGIPHLDTHRHNTEVVLGGVTYSRFIEFINGYTITFEDDQYAVNLVGSNNNISDVTNVNQVSIRSQNSAGLITVTSGSGVLPSDVTDIANAVSVVIDDKDLLETGLYLGTND